MVFPLLPSDWFQSFLDSRSSLFLLFIFLFYSMTSSNSQRRNARKVRNSKYLHVWESLYHASFHVSFSGMKLCDNNKDLPLSTDMQWSDGRHGTNWILPPHEQYFIFPRLHEGSFLYSWYSEMLHLFDSMWFFFIHSVSVGWILYTWIWGSWTIFSSTVLQ